MGKTIEYQDTQVPTNNEKAIMDTLSIPHSNIVSGLKSIYVTQSDRKIRQETLVKLATEYKDKLGEIQNTRKEIANTKHAKDKILYQMIENAKPPVSLKHSMFNYKALVLYFMHNFRDTTQLKLDELISKADSSLTKFDKLKELFNANGQLLINTHLDTLLHLINIDKGSSKATSILESMIYETIDYGDMIKDVNLFKNKVAVISWVKETITNPDFIYSGENIIATNLKFELGFYRQTGQGTSSEPFMYHFVGMKLIKKGNYTLISQFPIERDRKATTKRGDGKKVSCLHNFVQCNKPIYVKKDMIIPIYDEDIVSDNPATVDRLNRGFGNRL